MGQLVSPICPHTRPTPLLTAPAGPCCLAFSPCLQEARLALSSAVRTFLPAMPLALLERALQSPKSFCLSSLSASPQCSLLCLTGWLWPGLPNPVNSSYQEPTALNQARLRAVGPVLYGLMVEGEKQENYLWKGNEWHLCCRPPVNQRAGLSWKFSGRKWNFSW